MDKLWAVPQAAQPNLPAPETQGNVSGVKVSLTHDQRVLIGSDVTILKPPMKCTEDLFVVLNAPQLCLT